MTIPFKKFKTIEADDRYYKLKVSSVTDADGSKPTTVISLIMRDNEPPPSKQMREYLSFNGTPSELRKSIEMLQRIEREALAELETA